MAEKMWKGIKTIRCSHVGCDVELEVEEIYPADFSPINLHGWELIVVHTAFNAALMTHTPVYGQVRTRGMIRLK